MRKTIRGISALGAVFFVTAGLAACGGIPGDSVATVGGTSVTKTLFNHWMRIAAISTQPRTSGAAAVVLPQPPDYAACISQKRASAPKPAAGQAAPTTTALKGQCAQEYASLGAQVLNFLLSADWVIGEAGRQGVKVTNAQVQKQFTTLRNQQFPQPAQFNQFLASSGQTLNDILFRVRLDLLSTDIRNKVTKNASNVSQAAISNYYNQNRSRFSQPETRDLRIILTKTQAQANSARRAVQSGQSFATVAKKFSIDQATKARGGVLIGVARGQQEPALDTAVFASAKGVLTGPVKTPFGFYVFRVQKITPATTQSLAQVSSSIKQQLVAQQQQTVLNKFVTGFQKRWKAMTSCRDGYVVQDCKSYNAKNLSVQPGGSLGNVRTGSAGAPGAPATGAPPTGAGGAPPTGAGGAPPTGAGGAPATGATG